MIEDWYPRLQQTGLLDVLAPYSPVIVGSHPLGISPPGAPIEIVCRATDLDAFARLVQRSYAEREPHLHPGELDGEEAVFALFELDGLPLELAAQAGHVHQRLGAATLGVSRVLEEQGEAFRTRLERAVAGGEDWLEAALRITDLTRAALEALSGADPALARRVLGVRTPPPPLRAYLLPIAVGFTAEMLIVLAVAARGSTSSFAGLMFLIESLILGAVFGARMGTIAALAPLVAIGVVVGSSALVGSESCSPDCATQFAEYLFVALLVGSAAGISGLIRDRYLPRTPRPAR